MQETLIPPPIDDRLLQEPCEPVQREILGEPELANDPDFKVVFEDLTEDLVGQELALVPFKKHADTELGKIIDKGDSAKKVRTDLGCAGCRLSDVCLVNSALKNIVGAGEAARELSQKLEITRQGVAFIEALPSLFRLAYDDDTTQLVQDTTRTESIPKLLWGVDVKVKPSVKGSEVPEISEIAAIDKSKDLKSFEVSVDGNDYTLIDASDVLDIRRTNQPTQEYAKVLINKLFDRLRDKDEYGKPHLETPDKEAQKRIVSATDKDTYELRMGGKSRLYFIFKSGDSESNPRIILLGAHGDSKEQQDNFINAI